MSRMRCGRISVPCLLLAGFCLISCAGKQDSPGPTEEAGPPPSVEVSSELAALFPKPGEVPGWAMSRDVSSYGPESLWQFIDGAADRYLAYGFEEAAASEYAQEETGPRILIDIYRMKDPLNAYGIYTQERSPDSQFVKVGNEGYSTGTTLNFWAGSYYVKTTAFEEKTAAAGELTRLAGAVAAKATSQGAEPAEISYFPRTNLLPHTMTYIPRDVLGQSYFVNGFEAKYRSRGTDYRMILLVLESPVTSERALARYREFLSGGGKAVTDLAAPGQGGIAGTEGFYGSVVAVRSGRHVAMVLGNLSENEGKRLVGELLRNIR